MPLSSYLTRLIWLSILPVVVFSAWLSYDIVLKMQTESDQEASHTARNFATAIDHHLNARIGSLKVMAASPLADDPALWPLYYKVSQGYRENFGSHVIFAEADEPRRMIFNTRTAFGTSLPSLPKPKGSAAVPLAVASGNPAVGDIFVGPIAGEKLVAVAVPLVRLDKVSKVLLATFELRLFQERLAQVALPAGWGLSLQDSQGEVIARRQPVGNGSGNADEAYRRIVVKTTTAPWSVVLDIPRSIYLAPMMSAGLGLGISLLAVALIAIGAGLWGTRRLSRSVASLADRHHAQKGNGAEILEIAAVRQLIDADSKRIASFTATQNQAIEEERRRVAREVHDQLGQIFTALKMIVQSVPREAFPPGQEAALNQALEMGIASARKITADLRPPLLDDLGLADALEHFGKEIARTGNIDCQVAITDSGRLSPDQALGLFRITQEAATNTLRHAQARHIVISGQGKAGRYTLTINDDGCGFDPGTTRQGAMGLVNMQERAALMGGSCKITSRPGSGVRIEITLPMNETMAPA
jgi:signal transduction histidine kinase